MMNRIALTIIASLLTASAVGEGAVRTLDCHVERICDAAGICQDADGDVAFSLEPVELDAGGGGRYTIRYDETEAPMQSLSDLGPFVWTHADQRHVLIVSSETEWLWHELSILPEPAATIRYLRCEFQG